MSYENVYVAQVAYGAKDIHTLKAFREAEAYDGVSVIIAYSPCIEFGIDMANQHKQQVLAVDSGHWPLFRFDPRLREQGKNPLQLDSKAPKVDYKTFVSSERRFRMLAGADESVFENLQKGVMERFRFYEMLAGVNGDKKPAAVKPAVKKTGS